MKRIIPIVFLLGAIACNQQNQNYESDVAIPVSVEEVKTKSIKQYVTATGTVYPTSEAELKTEITGKYILQVNPRTNKLYQLGDKVKEDDIIIKLEDKEHENNIKIDAQKLSLDIKKRNFDYQKSLYEKGGVTLTELTNAESDYINAQYSYDNALLNLEKMNIVSPFKGIIVELPYHTQGVKIDNGQSVVKIMSYEKLYFEINLSEKELDTIKVGLPVMVQNYSYPNDTFNAEISQFSPVIDPDTRSFKGMVIVDNPQLKLRPGMFVKADIVTAQKDSAIVIPKELILTKNNRKVVYIVERSTARERQLTIGLENPDEVEIIRGLKINDRLVVKGFETLNNRAKVKVIR